MSLLTYKQLLSNNDTTHNERERHFKEAKKKHQLRFKAWTVGDKPTKLYRKKYETKRKGKKEPKI